MGYREIFDRIESGSLAGAFVFRGPEEYVKDRALETLKAKIVPQGLGDLNYQYLEGERANAAEIRRAAETLPFGSDMRLVVVRDYPMLASSSRGSGLDAARESEELGKLLSDFPKTTCLVFLQRVPPDRTRAAWKQLMKAAADVEFAPLGEGELVQQLGKIAKRCGCTVRRDAALFMLQYCGTGLESLSREMEKACAHAGQGNAVSRADIEAVCVQTQEAKVFGFIDLLFSGRAGGAMESLRRLAGDGEGAPALLSLIERQARLMVAAKAEGPKADAKALAATLGTPPFAVEAARRQAARWTGGDLRAVISMCAEADAGVKQGKYEIDTAVERVVMEVVLMADRLTRGGDSFAAKNY
jgi:DNA polymerase-3 subunit delta